MVTSRNQGVSFSAQLILLIAAALGVFALTSAAVSSSLLAERARVWIQDTLHTSVTQVAEANTLVFLTEDSVLAESVLAQLARIPGVRSAAFVTSGRRVIASTGETAAAVWPSPPEPGHEGDGRYLTEDTNGDWYVWAPAYAGGDEQTPYRSPDATPDRLGWVCVAWDSTLLTRGAWLAFAQILAAGTVIALIVAWLAHLLALRLTRPLSHLSTVMRTAETTADLTPAVPEGAREVQDIARAYNALIGTVRTQLDTINSQTQTLEAEVKARTSELATALARTEAIMRTLTHDMRTPVHSVLGYLQLAREELVHVPDTATLREPLDLATKASEILLARLQQLLDFARLQTGDTTINVAPIDLQAMTSRVENAVGGIAARNGNRLRMDVTSHGDTTYLSDEQKLERILANLVSNACRFTRDGEIRVRVAVSAGRLGFDVEDTGPGIPSERLETVFEPFRQDAPRESTVADGMGLGLHIARSYCQILEGTITVRSTPGQGAHFTVRIPLRDNESDAPIAANH